MDFRKGSSRDRGVNDRLHLRMLVLSIAQAPVSSDIMPVHSVHVKRQDKDMNNSH